MDMFPESTVREHEALHERLEFGVRDIVKELERRIDQHGRMSLPRTAVVDLKWARGTLIQLLNHDE